ncbi:MAG: hypothetical protein IKW48_07410 [Akkermansia sp.]|nr:hypothetical protein [Akkermansia sp.]
MNTNKLVTLLSAPMVMLAAAAGQAEARDVASQLRSLSAGTCTLLCASDIGDVDAYKEELTKRFSLFVLILNPECLDCHKPESQTEIAETLRQMIVVLSKEQVKSRLLPLREQDERFHQTVSRFDETIKNAFDHLVPIHMVLIDSLTSQLPDSYTALDKDRLVWLHLLSRCGLLLSDLTAESAGQVYQKMKVINAALAVLHDRMKGKENVVMHEDAAMAYMRYEDENVAWLKAVPELFEQNREKLLPVEESCPELVAEIQRCLLLGATIWTGGISELISADVRLIYYTIKELSRNIKDISPYEREVLLWYTLNLAYMEKLYLTDASEPAKTVGELSVILSAIQRVQEKIQEHDEMGMSDAVMQLSLAISLKTKVLMDKIKDSETVREVMDTNAELRHKFLHYMLLQMNDAVDKAMDSERLEAMYSLISTLKNDLPESFNDYDRTIFALYRIFLRTAILVGEPVEMDVAELVQLMKVHNAAGELLLDRIRSAASGGMSEAAGWYIAGEICSNPEPFNVFNNPTPQQQEHMRALIDACPEFKLELNRAQNLADRLRSIHEQSAEASE